MKDAQKSAKSTAVGKAFEGFTAEERAAEEARIGALVKKAVS